jgi:uncharacterized membrane protein YuzA (DUF378 family)
MEKLTALDWIAFTLVVVGAVNWGLVGLLQFDLVAAMFNNMSILARFVYALLGIASLWMIYFLMRLTNP